MGTIAILIQAVLTADAKTAAIALLSEAPEQIAALIPSPDKELAKARFEAAEEASMAVPAMEAFIIGLDTTYRNSMRERVVELGRAIIKLVADGHANAEDFDTEPQRAAVFEAIRFSMDALAPEVIPILARLALEPVDHFFRGLCRVVVDLDASEVLELRRLVEAASRAADDLTEYASVHCANNGERRDVIMFQPEGSLLSVQGVASDSVHGSNPVSRHHVSLMGALVALLARNLIAERAPWEPEVVLSVSLVLSVATVRKLKRVVLGS